MNTKKKYLIGIAVLFIAAILCMPVMGVSASPIKENPATSTEPTSPRYIPQPYVPPTPTEPTSPRYIPQPYVPPTPTEPTSTPYTPTPYKHSQPPVQGKRMGMPNPNADTEQYEQLMEKYKSPEWEARRAAEGTITEQPGNLITYAYFPIWLINNVK